MEMSFSGEDQVIHEVETLLRRLWKDMLDMDIPTIPRMAYQQAMSLYGSDKPDLRFASTVSLNTFVLKRG